MESGPSKIVEFVVYWLLPPASREEVLGDMRERNHGSAFYLVEAAHTIPSVVYSRVRRTTDAVLTLAAAISMYTAFVTAARWLNPDLLFRDYGFARLTIPPAIFLVVIMLADAYANPNKRWMLKPVFGPTLGFALAYAAGLNHHLRIPTPVMAWGCALSVVLVSTLRLIFLPVADRPQAARIPAFWQKSELLPPAFNLKNLLLPGAILLAIILCLLIFRA